MIKLTKIIFILCFTQLVAQNTVQLKGIVYSKTKLINEAHIYNSKTFKGVITNRKGEFSIIAQKDDILVISAMPFNEQKITITQKIIDKRFLRIKMYDNINKLDEVVVNSHNLTGNLVHDTKLVPKDVNQSYKVTIDISKYDLSSIPDTGNGVDRGNTEAFNGVPKGVNILGLVGLLANVAFPKKYIRPKPRNFTKNTPTEMRIELGDEFFIKELHVPKINIDDFLDEYCNTKEFIDLYEEDKIIECIEFLIEKNKLKKYVKV